MQLEETHIPSRYQEAQLPKWQGKTPIKQQIHRNKNEIVWLHLLSKTSKFLDGIYVYLSCINISNNS